MDQQSQSPSTLSNEGALKTSEKGIKKSGKVLPIILILVALAGVGFGVYGMFFKPEPTAPTCPTCVAENPEKPKEPTPQETLEPTEQNPDTTIEIPNLDKGQVLDPQKRVGNLTYTLREKSTEGILLKDQYENPYKLNISYDEKGEAKDWFIEPEDNNSNADRYQVLFVSGKPTDSIVGLFGQSSTGQKVIFLMDNGTLEYINPRDPIIEGSNIKTKKIKNPNHPEVQGIIGLSDVVKLNQVSISSVNGPGWLSVVAEDENGYYKDISDLMED